MNRDSELGVGREMGCREQGEQTVDRTIHPTAEDACTPKVGPALVCQIHPWTYAVRTQLGDGPLLCLSWCAEIDLGRLMEEIAPRLVGCTIDAVEDESGRGPWSSDRNWFVYRHEDGVLVALVGSSVQAYGREMSKVQDAIRWVRDRFCLKRKREARTPAFFVPEPEFGAMQFREVPLPGLRAMGRERLALHYGSDFPDWERDFVAKTRARPTGISILCGAPGTGKTTFIRHLMARLKRTHGFYFVPSAEIGILVSAGALSSWGTEMRMRKNHRVMIVLEDADPLLLRRAQGESSGALASLLNMADGLLGQILPVQIVCTANLPVRQMDPAVLRPGRLLAFREFRSLTPAEASALARAHGRDLRVERDITLAEVFATPALPSAERSRAIGFAANQPQPTSKLDVALDRA